MQPRFKPILEGHRGHVEVMPQALKAEVSSFFHAANMRGTERNLKKEMAIDFQ